MSILPTHQLDSDTVLMRRGLDPSDSDPRFHQQMVCAVVMKVIENFERALGRPIRFRGNNKLTVLPRAFEDENALLRSGHAVHAFRVFRGGMRIIPVRTWPARRFFTCLDHDIVAHETTHAIIDRMRDHFNAPTTGTCWHSMIVSPTSLRSSITSVFRRCCSMGSRRPEPTCLSRAGSTGGAACGRVL